MMKNVAINYNNSQAFGDLSMGNDGGCSMGQDEW